MLFRALSASKNISPVKDGIINAVNERTLLFVDKTAY